MDYVVKVNDFRNPGQTPKRSAIMSHINKILFINKLKHFNEEEQELVEFDAEKCAIVAILKAIVDYMTLTEKHTEAMKNFLAWTKENLNSAEIMKNYEKTSEKLKGF